jgi:hypothetical protein
VFDIDSKAVAEVATHSVMLNYISSPDSSYFSGEALHKVVQAALFSSACFLLISDVQTNREIRTATVTGIVIA